MLQPPEPENPEPLLVLCGVLKRDFPMCHTRGHELACQRSCRVKFRDKDFGLSVEGLGEHDSGHELPCQRLGRILFRA